jgi:hypothetical protein
MAPRSWAASVAKAPLKEPTGVRAAEAMTMSFKGVSPRMAGAVRSTAWVCHQLKEGGVQACQRSRRTGSGGTAATASRAPPG